MNYNKNLIKIYEERFPIKLSQDYKKLSNVNM